MNFLGEVLNFLLTRTPLELFSLFWYYILFDFTRYVLLDAVVLVYYSFITPRVNREKYNVRQQLFKENPLVSVVAVGRNEGKNVIKLVSSLKSQTYKNIEIIVIDDGSDDNTAEICSDLARQKIIDYFFRNDIRGGKASAANLALRYCKGKFIVHLDADSHLKSDSIEEIIIPFYWQKNIGAVAGDLRVLNCNDSIATSLQGIEYIKALSVGRIVNSTLGIMRIVSGAYGAFRKDILDSVGGWDVGPGLDGDLTAKIRKLHYQVYFEPAAVCYTNAPITFSALAKQRYRWDRSLIRFRIRKHSDVFTPDKNFSWRNFLSTTENIFFNLFLDFKWWIYIIMIAILYIDYLPYVLVINYVLYLVTNIVEFLVACILLRHTLRWKDFALALYLPLKPAYTGFYLRTVRTYAYIMEALFKTSFSDSWNPWKSSKIAQREE